MRIVAVLALLLATGVAFAWVARVDVVAPTRGEVIALERTRAVQAAEPGVVAALHVDEGARVRRGDLLAELDDTVSASEIRRLESRLEEARRTVRRLHAGREADEGMADADGHPRLGALERGRLAAALAEAGGRIEAGRVRRAAAEAERRSVERLLPVVDEQVEALSVLLARSHASRADYLRELSRRIELEGRAEALALDVRYEEAEIARLRAVRRLLRLEQDAAWQRERVEAEALARELREELVQARRRHARHRIAAPIDGVVQDLGELAAGSYVDRGDRLMTVVPAGGGLEIRAYVGNRDVGFVEPGQEAIVKVDAFPFTRFGTTEGVVEGLSLNTIAPGALEAAGLPEAAGAAYLARIALTRPALEIDGDLIPLRPGMQAAIDIRTGRRRLLEYVLSPLVAYGANAFRER